MSLNDEITLEKNKKDNIDIVMDKVTVDEMCIRDRFNWARKDTVK